MPNCNYLSGYSPKLQAQISEMLEKGTLKAFLIDKYPKVHDLNNDKSLRNYVLELKNQYLRKSDPLSKIVYDNKIHVINNALGLHTYISRNHGGKLKAKNELRVSALFKRTPIEFLNMIVVHELAHLKEREHNKAFYQLCNHMQPSYHQLEFDLRVYLSHLELVGEVYD
jgi:predicted metal-dependent hydrolase